MVADFVRINGETNYLWRAVDHEGKVQESYVTKKRDKAAAHKILRKVTKRYGQPKVVVTDKFRSKGAAASDITSFAFYLRHSITLTGDAVVVKQPRSMVSGIQTKRKLLLGTGYKNTLNGQVVSKNLNGLILVNISRNVVRYTLVYYQPVL